MFTFFVNPNRGFIHTFTSEQGCITPEKLGHQQKTIQFLFANKKKFYLPEVESRTQGSRPRPRTQKKSEAKDSLSEDRRSRGQGQECSRPRPRTKDTKRKCSPTKKKKKRFSPKIFRRSPKKKGLHKNFSSDLH